MNTPKQNPRRPQRPQITAIATSSAIALVIAGLTLTPSMAPPTALVLSDKAYHAIAFATLVFPLAAVVSRSLVWVALPAFLYGAMIEAIQSLVGRSAELADLVANAIGIFIGFTLAWSLRAAARRMAPSRSSPARRRR